ncbi:hypothetical protein IGS73_04775 [Janibacter indicus]|uniref:Uncharacterized protein n=1 Tax=Janibacter indicus TaxID=857417 RepID=A0A1L3MF32_9MICO|nr:hypothetical protein [Janibacter indicus]APH00930.1 hypothetical protein ASJ30_04765 [Janibacter indicus]QOK23710.1 hypothetical protein IGS73_04775 [Janibacter indicus]
MTAHTRWWLAATVLIALRSLAGLWLEGTAQVATTTALALAVLVTAAAGLFSWFRHSQQDPASNDPAFAPAEGRRAALTLIGALLVFAVVSAVLRTSFADATWFRPVMSLVIVTFWGLVAAQQVRRSRSGGSGPE